MFNIRYYNTAIIILGRLKFAKLRTINLTTTKEVLVEIKKKLNHRCEPLAFTVPTSELPKVNHLVMRLPSLITRHHIWPNFFSSENVQIQLGLNEVLKKQQQQQRSASLEHFDTPF